MPRTTVHLLADVVAIGGVDSTTLKDVVFEVVNANVDPVDHTDRILGEGAIGDYTLDPATGDMIETRSYVAYQVIETGGGYVWAPVAQKICRWSRRRTRASKQPARLLEHPHPGTPDFLASCR